MSKQLELFSKAAMTPNEIDDANERKTLTFRKYANELDHDGISLGEEFNISASLSRSDEADAEITDALERYLTSQGDTSTIDHWLIFLDPEEEWGFARARTAEGHEIIDVGITILNH
jgi:hypothetical protein